PPLPDLDDILEESASPDEELTNIELPGEAKTPVEEDIFGGETEIVDLDSLEQMAVEETDGGEDFASEFSDRVEEIRDAAQSGQIPEELKDEIKDILLYMDQLLESLPDEKIQEFARSPHFEVYKKIFEELGIKK
ncbi:MAG: hypothetical protein MJA31_13580, partial [Clostridia bacterium]|nr:hypothetical protein [Clostridia bacterium]